MLFDDEAHLAHGRKHFGPQVTVVVDGRHREVPALDGRPVAHVALGIVLQARAGTFHAVDLVEAEIAARAELHAVEDEELGFRADDDGVADAGRLHIGFAALRGGAGIAAVALPRRWFDDVAEQDERRLGGERVHHGRIRVRHQDHVQFVDRLPPRDRGAVEHDAVPHRVLVNRRDVLGRVLPFAARIGEPEVHILDRMLGDHFHHLSDALGAGAGVLRHAQYLPLMIEPITAPRVAPG